MNKTWILSDQNPEAESVLLSGGIPPIAAKVLAARGIDSISEAKDFLNTDISIIEDPNRLPDIDAACSRIRKALDNGERIAVFGDYDVDGLTAVCLVVKWLRKKEADCIYYIPNRVEEGYGLNVDALEQLAQKGVSLVITVDLGITAIEEALWAKQNGLDLIITDHHKCRDDLPEACAVVNPRRADSEYSFKYLSGVGVAFMLVLAYEGFENIEPMMTEYSDLVALGTVSDMMPMIKTNRVLVHRGIQEINRGNRVGLKALVRESASENAEVNTGIIGFSIAPRLNAAGRMGYANDELELLLTDDPQAAQRLTEKVCELNRERQKTENDTYHEVVEYYEENIRNTDKDEGPILICNDTWHPGVIGIIASRLSERYARPAFLISLKDGVGRGSVRSFYGVNILTIMQKVSHLFETWGGHEYAAGFTIPEENIPALSELLKNVSCELETPHINIDTVLDGDMLTENTISDINTLEPFGPHNAMPAFLIRNMEIKDIIPLGWGNSLRLKVAIEGKDYPAFYFGGHRDRPDMCCGDIVDAVCKLEGDRSRGESFLRIVLLDIRLEKEANKKLRIELELFNRLKTGKDITRKEAVSLMPKKSEFVALLRHIHRNSDSSGSVRAMIGSMLRTVSREENIELSYARFLVCFEALAEKNRLTYSLENDQIEVKLLEGCPTNLNTSKILMRLRELSEN